MFVNVNTDRFIRTDVCQRKESFTAGMGGESGGWCWGTVMEGQGYSRRLSKLGEQFMRELAETRAVLFPPCLPVPCVHSV